MSHYVEDPNFSPFNELSLEDNMMLYSALNSEWSYPDESLSSGPPSTFPMKLPSFGNDVPTWTVYSTGEDDVSTQNFNFVKPRNSVEYDIQELEKKLNDLRNDNWMLKKEHESLLRQSVSDRDTNKPAPLLRSFSSELRDSDKEIDTIMINLKKLSMLGSGDDGYVPVLNRLHQHVSKRQNIITKEAQQFASPKLQEGLVRLDGVNTGSAQDFALWIESLSKRGVSEPQKVSIKDLLSFHYDQMSVIHEERKMINVNIRSCYHANTKQDVINLGDGEYPVIIALSNQIELLKKSI
jgi:hypothetical protein